MLAVTFSTTLGSEASPAVPVGPPRMLKSLCSFLTQLISLIYIIASDELALSPLETQWVVYEQEIRCHWWWQKIGKARGTKQVSLSCFCKNRPHGNTAGKGSVLFTQILPRDIRLGPMCTIHRQTLRLAEGGRDFGARNHFCHFSPGAQLRLSSLSPSLADWPEYMDRRIKYYLYKV